MVKVGITGGIGSGKTKICEVMQLLGAYMINADDLAKDLMTNNDLIKNEIINTFGKQSYRADGSMNRTFLARQAFEKGRVEELNAIVHPHIPDEIERLMDAAEERGYEVAVYEAALLLQNRKSLDLDLIVLVLAEKEKRIERVIKRDEIKEQEVLDRIDNQQDFNEFKDYADIIIQNNGSIQNIEEHSKALYHEIVNAYDQ